ncbi:MAG: fumarylacetoacetate hydrolase family protein [Acidimicrobiia bacterium]|nr:fumarylacetoacetate hydrolase family protein [Acidimicrobiia bacterium]
MKLCRFDRDRLGLVDGDRVRDVTAALDALPSYRYPLPEHDVLLANLDIVRARVEQVAPAAAGVPLDSVVLRSPVANPGKIIAAPVNYQTHLDEARANADIHHNNPLHTLTIQTAGLFLKATSSLAGPGDGIAIRWPDRRTDPEVELVIVVGRQGTRIGRDRAMDHVAGYTIGLDVTTRGTEDRSFRKSSDSYSIVGPWLVTADELPDPGALDLSLSINGEQKQASNTRHLIVDVAGLVEMASSFYTLYPGDVIFTGTPEGVSPIQAGDRVVASVAGIGTLKVAVR